MTAPGRVLIFLLSGIGDTLMFTPALRLLRQAWPQSRLVALTMRESERDLLALNPNLDEVRFAPLLKQSWTANLRDALKLRGEHFDLSILPCPTNRIHYNVLAFLAGASQRAAFRYLKESRRNLDFLNNVLLPHQDNVHNVEHNLILAQTLTGASRSEDLKMQLSTSEEDRKAAESFLEKRGLTNASLLGFHISSSRAKHMERKCWPKERFASVIQSLGRENPRDPFLLFCGADDLEESQWLARQNPDRMHLVQDLPIRVVAEILRRCRVLVTNDSGLQHVAAAMETPVVAIFGPTNPLRTGPWHTRSAIARTGIACSPCFYHTSAELTCPAGIDFACLKELSEEAVLSEIRQMISNS